jgi:hypothetical protein
MEFFTPFLAAGFVSMREHGADDTRTMALLRNPGYKSKLACLHTRGPPESVRIFPDHQRALRAPQSLNLFHRIQPVDLSVTQRLDVFDRP